MAAHNSVRPFFGLGSPDPKPTAVCRHPMPRAWPPCPQGAAPRPGGSKWREEEKAKKTNGRNQSSTAVPASIFWLFHVQWSRQILFNEIKVPAENPKSETKGKEEPFETQPTCGLASKETPILKTTIEPSSSPGKFGLQKNCRGVFWAKNKSRRRFRRSLSSAPRCSQRLSAAALASETPAMHRSDSVTRVPWDRDRGKEPADDATNNSRSG